MQVYLPAVICNSRTLWPSEMNLKMILFLLNQYFLKMPKNLIIKGFFIEQRSREEFYLGVGHIAINVNLSVKGHTFI